MYIKIYTPFEIKTVSTDDSKGTGLSVKDGRKGYEVYVNGEIIYIGDVKEIKMEM